jgi:hypothetical protein
MVFTCYVDDSGFDGKSPMFVLGAWIADCEAWDMFSNLWEIALDDPRPLVAHNGKRYFHHTDAMNRTKCFEGFSVQETIDKMQRLGSLILPFRHHMLGYISLVSMKAHKECVSDPAVRVRGEINPVHQHPFYVAFKELVPDVYESYWNQGVREPIDIIVDGEKEDRPLRDMKATFEYVKEESKGEPGCEIMGDIFGRSAKDLAPLQLADMLASQTRMKSVDLRKAFVRQSWDQNQMQIHRRVIKRAEMKGWGEMMNATLSLKRLATLKNQRENPKPKVMSKRRVRKQTKPT